MSKDCRHFLDTPIIVAVGVVRESRKFSGHPYGAETFCRPGLFAEMSRTQCTCSFISTVLVVPVCYLGHPKNLLIDY